MLAPIAGGYIGQINDALARPGLHRRHHARVRELASCAIIGSIADSRMKQAELTRSRPAGELMAYQPGQLVDLWSKQTRKDVEGWRGPGKIATVQAEEGNVTIRYQGRTLASLSRDASSHTLPGISHRSESAVGLNQGGVSVTQAEVFSDPRSDLEHPGEQVDPH